MNTSKISILQKLFKWCFLGYLAVLPMSNTIALRNLLLFALVCFVLFFTIFWRSRLEILSFTGYRHVPLIVVLWIVFLSLFPLWAVQTDVAWQNLRGQWIQSIFAWIVGFGAVLLLGKRGPSIWALALASAFPLAVHLLLYIAAWGGILTGDFYANPSIASVWTAFSRALNSDAAMTWNWQSIPIGFLGIEPMHGNLGYAACQAIVLISACFCIAWHDQNKYRLWRATLFIILCFLSLFIAQSRGAILFGLIMLLTTAVIYFYKCSANSTIKASKQETNKWPILKIGAAAAIGLLLIAAFQSIRHQERWYSMADKVEIGLLSEKPLNLLCNGVSSQVEAQIRERFADRDPAYVQVLLNGLKGQDGGRILLMRVGIDLVLENPRGLDGSMHSYQKLIKEKCGHEPTLYFSHAHQGWIDLALALGWVGALLFSWMIICFFRIGFSNMKILVTRPWAIALFLTSTFWMLRGFADEVYREHYLQMQGLMLAYIFGRLLLELTQDKFNDITKFIQIDG